MPRGPKKASQGLDGLSSTSDYRHDQTRKNLPSAAMAGEGQIPKAKRQQYAYSPHLDPVLRFDPTGRADKVRGIVEKACAGKPLTADEQEILRAVGANWEQPWLEWANKQEEHARGHFSVDPVALHIHERISAQAILRTAQRQDAERSLFADPEQSYSESLKFYRHDVDWANRLILGDSLQVMSSLAHRENLAGKVQMIYIDPPYGIKFASNFQPELGKVTVKERDEDLSSDPEMVRAFRDTWHLGISSYLAYLRARLKLAHGLLCEEGSIFVQISDENLHLVQTLLDEQFGRENCIATIAFRKKTMPLGTNFVEQMSDFLLWYGKRKVGTNGRPNTKYHRLFRMKSETPDSNYKFIETSNYQRVAAALAPRGEGALFRLKSLEPSGVMEAGRYRPAHEGREYDCPANGYAVTREGMSRLQRAGRLEAQGRLLNYALFIRDNPASAITIPWHDTAGADEKQYTVQTNTEVVRRCMLMTTDPGDLVLDPTCGSGTTAVVAEEWGRRWITIDTSRVALSVARQRLLTARFEHYRTAGGPQGALGAENPGSGLTFGSAPHITVRSIAQNQNLDPIFAMHEPILTAKLKAANDALAAVPAALRAKLKEKLAAKEKAERKKSITDADRRRWILPPDNRDPKEKWTVDAKFTGWYDWEVPFDTDPDWPKPLQDAVTAYRAAWRAKMDEVNACIAKNAEQEELVDQPEVVKGVVRVSGPFTVEGVIPEELNLTDEGLVDYTPNEDEDGVDPEALNLVAYLDKMIAAIRRDGVKFPNNQHRKFERVDRLYDDGTLRGIHAEAAWAGEDEAKVAIAFGPQYGPMTALQAEDASRAARRYEHVVLAGFSFAPEVSAFVQQNEHPRQKVHLAHIRPDLNPGMDGLLKDTPNSELFTVFGMPSIEVRRAKNGEWTVTLEGVDIYDPVRNEVRSTKAEKVAAWFLDSDYDGRCFCVTQAFFPNQDAWDKLAKALGTQADAEAFAAFKGTESLAFAAGRHQRLAVKVIDPRGNEVMAVRKLED
jgi:adenine-specific DNA-methyltransferase